MDQFAVGILVIVGACGLVTASLVITAAVCTWWFDWRCKPHSRSFNSGQDYERLRLMNDSWWFSEHEPTMHLLQDLAQAKTDIIDIRHNWRKRMSAQLKRSEKE